MKERIELDRQLFNGSQHHIEKPKRRHQKFTHRISVNRMNRNLFAVQKHRFCNHRTYAFETEKSSTRAEITRK